MTMPDERPTVADLGEPGGEDSPLAALAPEVSLPEPRIDARGRAYATGKRKDAVARVWIKPGRGMLTVNGREGERYFARPVLRMIVNHCSPNLLC